MKALMSIAPGGPRSLELREVPDPMPGPGEVRIAVRACAINFPDTLVIEDKYQFKPPRPFAPGMEVAGVVEALGAGVEAPALGSRVIAHALVGGLAEKLIARAAHCVPMPDAMAFEVGASLLVTYGTSIHALQDRGRLRAGETLLVLGAAGGVGLAAVELGKVAGARVIAAVSSEGKAAVARAHGADATLVYPSTVTDPRALTAAFKDACGPSGADVIYDPVGGPYAEPRTACHRLGGPLSRGRLSSGDPATAAQPRAAQGLRHLRRVLGQLRRAQPGTAPRACEEPAADVPRGPHPPGDLRSLSSGARRRGARSLGGAPRHRQGRGDDRRGLTAGVEIAGAVSCTT